MSDLDIEDEFEWHGSFEEDDTIPALAEEKKTFSFGNTAESKAENRKKDIELYRFIAAISQIEYNFYSNEFDHKNLPDLSDKIAKNIRVGKIIAEKFDYNINNLTHLYYFNILLRQISHISSAASLLGSDALSIIGNEEAIDKVLNANIDGIVILEDELATNEVSMHIKSVLIPYSIHFNSTVCETIENIDLTWFLDTTINITKSIATKWNENLKINKRQQLFVNTLDTVARFVMHKIYSYLKTSLSKEDKIGKNLWDAITEMHLGLSDYPTKRDALIEKVDIIISAEISDFYLANSTLSTLVSKERTKLRLLAELYNDWVDFHDTVIAELSMMGADEREKYFDKNKVADFSTFIESLPEKCKHHIAKIQTVEIDKGTFISNTKNAFSTLWGTSDAYCKTIG